MSHAGPGKPAGFGGSVYSQSRGRGCFQFGGGRRRSAAMKVVVTDYTFPNLDLEAEVLRPLGVELVGGQAKSSAQVAELAADADAVITQFARVDAAAISALHRARVIVRYGIGVDNVDLAAAQAKGIPVCNVPDYCIDEVADHTLAMILACTRALGSNGDVVRQGQWRLGVPLEQMRTLRDLTVGIVGFGRIGREVAARLTAFKCRRLVFDPVVAAEAVRAGGCEPASWSELLTAANVLTLHCPSTDETRGMIDAAALGRLPRGAIVVNVARGDLVVTTALAAALESGQVSAAALDVCDVEPPPSDSLLRQLPNVLLTSHIASASEKAVRTLRMTAAGIAVAALQGQPPPNVVNRVK